MLGLLHDALLKSDLQTQTGETDTEVWGRDRDVREFGAISKDGYDLQKTP